MNDLKYKTVIYEKILIYDLKKNCGKNSKKI